MSKRCQGHTKQLHACKRTAGSRGYCKTHAQMYKYERPNECLICAEPLSAVVRPTKCGHYMHTQCLRKWLKQSDNCPVCRQPLQSSLQHSQQPEIIELEFNVSSALTSLQSSSIEELQNLSVEELLLRFLQLVQYHTSSSLNETD